MAANVCISSYSTRYHFILLPPDIFSFSRRFVVVSVFFCRFHGDLYLCCNSHNRRMHIFIRQREREREVSCFALKGHFNTNRIRLQLCKHVFKKNNKAVFVVYRIDAATRVAVVKNKMMGRHLKTCGLMRSAYISIGIGLDGRPRVLDDVVAQQQHQQTTLAHRLDYSRQQFSKISVSSFELGKLMNRLRH